jgi:hypothetical protein
MALEANDLMVIQKNSGAQEIRKATLDQLSVYLQTTDSVSYKGALDFSDGGAEPAGPNTGDLYINDGLGTEWNWSPNSDGIDESTKGDRAIWNGSTWDLITSGVTDNGVTEVQGQLPIVIDDGDTATVTVKVNPATTAATGVVQIADATAIENGTAGMVVTADNQATDAVYGLVKFADADAITNGDDDRAVTAEQLKVVDDKVDGALSGGIVSIVGQDPITVNTTDNGATVNAPHVGIEDAAVGQKGAVAQLDTAAALTNPADSVDYATWVATLDDSLYISARFVAKNFVPLNFAGLVDIDA